MHVSYIYIHLFILHGYITNSWLDSSVGTATGIAEVMGSNPVQA